MRKHAVGDGLNKEAMLGSRALLVRRYRAGHQP